MTCRKPGAVSWLGLHIPPLSCSMLSQCLKLSDPVGRVVPPTLLGMSWGLRGLPGEETSSNTLCVCAHTLEGTLKLFRCLGRKQRNKALLLGCLGVKKPSF